MDAWTLSFTAEAFILDVTLVGALLLAATLCRRYVGLVQRYLIPNSLLAGFLGLLLGPELLGWVDFSVERMGVYVYHLLALTFIGVGLYGGGQRHTDGAINLGFIQVMTMLLQAIIGLGVALGLIYLFSAEVVPAVGMLLPLGFAMGPGIAYSIGQGWGSFGFAEGANIGLTIAAIGFLVAYLSGIAIVHRGIRLGQTALGEDAALATTMRTGIVKDGEATVGARLTFFSGAIEPLTFHVALIGALYLLTYAVVSGLAALLVGAGLEQEVPTLWSFHFILANLLALGVRKAMDARGIAYVIDEGLITRVTGALADYLIATSIMAISLSIAWAYLAPIVVMCLVGTLVTYLSIRWLSERVFEDYHFERFVGIYGQMTGTISSGLALIRVTDPHYRTPVSQDLVLSSGMALTFGFPLLVLINLPFTLFDGQLEGYWTVLALMIAYLAFIMVVWTRFGLRRRKTATL